MEEMQGCLWEWKDVEYVMEWVKVMGEMGLR